MMTVTQPSEFIRIVLVRPKFPGNMGSVARILANTGLSDFAIVKPAVPVDSQDARRLSARAEPILLAAHIVDELSDALGGMTQVVGTTARKGLYREQHAYTPRQFAKKFAHTHRPTAILFGPEDQGLSNEDLLHCDATLTIPTHENYPSLNLSHAVMVVAYELFVACQKTEIVPAKNHANSEPADAAVLDVMMKKLEKSLTTIGYLDPDNPQHLLIALRTILGKANLTRQEAQILIGLAQQIETHAQTGLPHRQSRTNRQRD